MTPTPRPGPLALTRRSFLVGAGAVGTLLVAGCSDGSTSTGAASTTTSNPDALNLVLRFDPNSYALAGIAQRLVVSVLDNRAEPPADLPDSLQFQLTLDGAAVGEPVAASAHDDGVPVPYYPVRTTIAEAGTYALTTTVGGSVLSAPLVVSDPSTSTLVEPGQAIPLVDTPTVDDHRGVDPICTRQPEPCSFHAVDLTSAVAAGTPTALLVSTPQFCQIGVCGPVLELLTEAAPAHPGITVIHAEVYTGPSGPDGPTTPTVDALGLSFEPSLYLVGADGVVVNRLDIVFDRSEITEALDELAAAPTP